MRLDLKDHVSSALAEAINLLPPALGIWLGGLSVVSIFLPIPWNWACGIPVAVYLILMVSMVLSRTKKEEATFFHRLSLLVAILARILFFSAVAVLVGTILAWMIIFIAGLMNLGGNIFFLLLAFLAIGSWFIKNSRFVPRYYRMEGES